MIMAHLTIIAICKRKLRLVISMQHMDLLLNSRIGAETNQDKHDAVVMDEVCEISVACDFQVLQLLFRWHPGQLLGLGLKSDRDDNTSLPGT